MFSAFNNRRLSLSVAATATVVAVRFSVFAPLAPATAQPASVVKPSGAVKPGVVTRGGRGEVLVTLAIQPGWHVYASDPGNSNYIATTASGKSASGVTFGKPRFPKASSLKTSADPKPVNVYQGKAVIAIPFTVAKTAKPGRQTLTTSVMYQSCNDKMCLPPETVPVSVAVTVK